MIPQEAKKGTINKPCFFFKSHPKTERKAPATSKPFGFPRKNPQAVGAVGCSGPRWFSLVLGSAAGGSAAGGGGGAEEGPRDLGPKAAEEGGVGWGGGEAHCPRCLSPEGTGTLW